MRRFAFVLGLLFVPVVAQAQVRGGGAGAGHAVIMAPRPMQHAAVSYGGPQGRAFSASRVPQGRTGPTNFAVHRRSGNRPVSRPVITPAAYGQSSGFLPDFTGVPGLGFDYVHYAAVHPGVGRTRRGGYPVYYGSYFPFFDSGFLLPYAQSYAAPDEAPVYEGQTQDAGDASGDGSTSGGRIPGYGLRTISSYDVVVTPQSPSEAYVFVRRDGTLFFAVAYSLSLIHIFARWDLNWQAVYRYAQPVKLPHGTSIVMRYVYDNSRDNLANPNDPPQRVVAGNRASDEMAHLWLQVLAVCV